MAVNSGIIYLLVGRGCRTQQHWADWLKLFTIWDEFGMYKTQESIYPMVFQIFAINSSAPSKHRVTLPKANISPEKSVLKMMFLFQRWDMLVLRRVYQLCKYKLFLSGQNKSNVIAMLAYHHYKPTQCFVSPKLSSSVFYFLEPGCLPKSKCLNIRRSLGYNSR